RARPPHHTTPSSRGSRNLSGQLLLQPANVYGHAPQPPQTLRRCTFQPRLELFGILRIHDIHSQHEGCPPRQTIRLSFANGSKRSLNIARPRCVRDLIVPTGTPRILAASAWSTPSTSTSKSVHLKSPGSPRSASIISWSASVFKISS